MHDLYFTYNGVGVVLEQSEQSEVSVVVHGETLT